VWGTPVYMSPEQCTGKTLDARSDIYALGIVFYECLTGKQIFTGKRITDVIMKQLMQAPEPFKSACPERHIPEWLEAVVMKALEKDPINRFQTMEDMRRALELEAAANQAAVAAGATAATQSTTITAPLPAGAQASTTGERAPQWQESPAGMAHAQADEFIN